jgi:hypothetical protein
LRDLSGSPRSRELALDRRLDVVLEPKVLEENLLETRLRDPFEICEYIDHAFTRPMGKEELGDFCRIDGIRQSGSRRGKGRISGNGDPSLHDGRILDIAHGGALGNGQTSILRVRISNDWFLPDGGVSGTKRGRIHN